MLQFVAASALTPLMNRPANGADICVDSASDSLRMSLNYKLLAAAAQDTCSVCAFFTGKNGGGGSSCGNCAIMSGPVDARGHCDSWAAKG
jgi:hypothetical protein